MSIPFNKSGTRYEMIPSKLLQDLSAVSPPALLLLLALSTFKECYIQYSTIAKLTGLKSYSTIAKAIKELESKNIIVVQRIKGPGSTRNTYTFVPFEEWNIRWDDKKVLK